MFRRLREADKVREEDRQLLAGGDDFNAVTALENRGVELRRKVLGKLVREAFKLFSTFSKRASSFLYERVELVFTGKHCLSHFGKYASQSSDFIRPRRHRGQRSGVKIAPFDSRRRRREPL